MSDRTQSTKNIAGAIKFVTGPLRPDYAPNLIFADLILDLNSRELIRSGQRVPLTAKEFDLLKLFMDHPQQVLSREFIFRLVWGSDSNNESNVLDVYIRHLREKMESRGEVRLIHTLRGVGFVLRELPKSSTSTS